MKIASFTAWLIEGDKPTYFRWREGLPHSHAGLPGDGAPKRAVVQLQTDEGPSALIDVDFGPSMLDVVDRRFGHFIGIDPILTEHVWQRVWEIDRIEEFHIRQLGVLDMLCWDLKSRMAGMPLYQMLGGNRKHVPVYASTVTWETLADYEEHIKLCQDVGYKAFKLHAWGDVKRDIELISALRQWTGPDADLMFDGSAGWDFVDAMTVGRALQDEGYLWYEEPMREFYLGAYTKLTDKLDIPILAAETSDGVHWNMASWIEAGALDMTRVSSHFKGGLTGSMKIAHLSESFGMRAQVHGMGRANAQLCGALANNDYYEQLVMDREQILGASKLGEGLAVVEGMLTVSDEPGLGCPYDVETLDRIALGKVVVDQED